MNSSEPKSEKTGPADQEHRSKKPYRKPAFHFERVFETSALACGKTPGSPQQQCRPRGKS